MKPTFYKWTATPGAQETRYRVNLFQGLMEDKMEKFSRGPPRNFGPREMHKATCAECGSECEVPFKPAGGKPVYCRDCYRKKKGFQ